MPVLLLVGKIDKSLLIPFIIGESKPRLWVSGYLVSRNELI